MSRLDELIQELCPDGVEFHEMGEVCRLVTGATPSRSNPSFWVNGAIPWMSSGEVNNKQIFETESKITQLGYDKTSTTIVPIHTVVIALAGQGKTRGKVAITEIELCTNQSLCSIICGPTLNYKFLYYYLDGKYEELRTISNGDGTRGGLSLKILSPYKIPVPPLSVQTEIVRILDNFAELTAQLQEQLTLELAARKKQYEYYRDKLLTFDVRGGGALEQQNDVVWRTLRSIVKSSCSGGTPAKGNNDYYKGGTIPWIRTQDVQFNEIYKVDTFITETAVKETSVKWIPENCVIVAISGASAGRCAINKIRATTNQHCLNMEVDPSQALYRYVYHCVCNKYQELLTKKQGARGDLNSTLILETEIPVPPLPVQQRIVNVLDNFNAICSDLSIGLPAEIEARQKQYEYYRDLLLSFDDCSQLVHVERERERERPERRDVIKLLQYVFGYVILPLEQCCEVLDKKRMPVTKSARVAGEYPYYGANGIQDYVSDYIFDGVFVLVGEDGSVITKDGKPVVTWAEGKIWVNNHAHIIAQIEDVSLRYLFHYIQTVDVTALIHGNIPKLTGKDFRNISIYLPPIKEQVRKATILDRLYALCNDLTSGLPAEIEARQKQYEYYRDKLLTFKELNS